MAAKMATLRELSTFYSLEDVYLMLEILSVDVHNARLIAKSNADRS